MSRTLYVSAWIIIEVNGTIIRILMGDSVEVCVSR